jgi:hypothetical protein
MVDLSVTGHGGVSKGSGILLNVSSPSQVQVKSFCEVGKIARVFRAFDDAKRELVRSIGFDGLLKTPFIDRLDDKFSFWLMSCLDPTTMILGLPNGESLAIKDVDAHFVLGIPFRGKQVCHDRRHDKDVVSNVLGKLSIGGHKARLTLEYLEWILEKEYGDNFLPEEKVAFKISVVLYSMACFLAAHGPKISFPIWLFGNFVGSSKIHAYNWCGYILSVLAHGAMQLQEQLRNGDDLVKLHGCTFLLQVCMRISQFLFSSGKCYPVLDSNHELCYFFQVLYLDNIDFGPSSAAHLDIPRGYVYNTLYLEHLIDIDSEQHAGSEVVEYGLHKVMIKPLSDHIIQRYLFSYIIMRHFLKQLRLGSEVCYSRGWEGPSFGKWGEYESTYVSTSVSIGYTKQQYIYTYKKRVINTLPLCRRCSII